MPNKYSHRVVLAHYSSLGLVDLPNDTELLNYAGLSYSAYAVRSKKYSASAETLAPSKTQLLPSRRGSTQTCAAKPQSPPLPFRPSDSQHGRARLGAENSTLRPSRDCYVNASSSCSRKSKTAPRRVYLADEDTTEFEPSESKTCAQDPQHGIDQKDASGRPATPPSAPSNTHSVASSFGLELPMDSTLVNEGQVSQYTSGPSSNESASQAASGSVWSNSEQSYTPLTSPTLSCSRSPRHSNVSNSSGRLLHESGYQSYADFSAMKRVESPQWKANDVAPSRGDNTQDRSPLEGRRNFSRKVHDAPLRPEPLYYEQAKKLSKEVHEKRRMMNRNGRVYEGGHRLDSPTLGPETELQSETSKNATATKQTSRSVSEYSTDTQVYRPLPTQPDFDSFDLGQDDLSESQPLDLSPTNRSSAAASSKETLPTVRHERSQQLRHVPKPKSTSELYSSDCHTLAKQAGPISTQPSVASPLRSCSSYSSLSSLSDFTPSPLLPPLAIQKPNEGRLARSLNHAVSTPSLTNAHSAFSHSIFEGFEPRARDDTAPPLPRINLYSDSATRHEPDAASVVSSNALFPPDIPISRRTNSTRANARDGFPTSTTLAESESKPRDLAKAIAEAELKVKTLKQEAAKESFGRKSGNRLKKFLGRGKPGA